MVGGVAAVGAVVVDEVAGAVEDRAAAVDLDAAQDVARMAEDEVRARVDQRVGERPLGGRRVVAEVRSPVGRRDEDVDVGPRPPHGVENPVGARVPEPDRAVEPTA